MKTKIFNLNTTICDSVRLVDPFAENQCWCHFFLPLMKIMYDHQNLSKKVGTGWRVSTFVKNQLNMDNLCFVRLLILIILFNPNFSIVVSMLYQFWRWCKIFRTWLFWSSIVGINNGLIKIVSINCLYCLILTSG